MSYTRAIACNRHKMQFLLSEWPTQNIINAKTKKENYASEKKMKNIIIIFCFYYQNICWIFCAVVFVAESIFFLRASDDARTEIGNTIIFKQIWHIVYWRISVKNGTRDLSDKRSFRKINVDLFHFSIF